MLLTDVRLEKAMNNLLNVFCETLTCPLGVDNPNPRFSWRPADSTFRFPQMSYEISVFKGDEIVWSTGRVESSNSVSVEYGGGELESFTEYVFRIKSELADGAELFGEGTFETGILRDDQWQGEFLAYGDYEKRVSPVFYTSFNCRKPVKKARAYFCGLGYGELYINGKKTDESLLDPAWTDYAVRVLYRTFDITDMLENDNRIAVILGDGWMAHNHKYFEVSRKPPLSWYHEPCFLLNLRVTYEDGETVTFCPNADNTLVNESHILSNNVFDGEIYDARIKKQLYGGEEPSAEKGWKAPVISKVTGKLSSQLMRPIMRTEELRPVKITSVASNIYTVDMGINFSGFLKLSLLGAEGSKVTVRYSEAVRDDDTVNCENLRYAQCCDTYILSGEAEGEEYSPRFTYRGFRYAEITLDGSVKVMNVLGVRVNSAVDRIGSFECDNQMLNRIYAMLINTEINNMHSVPTDCPQRDERLGWLNDNTLRLEQNFMNFDSRLFYEKWLTDLRDTQEKLKTGALADTAPYFYGLNPARWNTTVFISIPYFLYKYYGDMQPMKKHWKNLLWYMDFQKTKLTEEGLINEYYVGEWCPPMRDSILEDRQSAFAKDIKNQLATSCFYYYECRMCAEMAEILGDKASASRFLAEFERVKQAVNNKFFDYERGVYVPECQGNNIFPLFLGITPDGYEKKVARRLIDLIVEKDGYHISTGSHMTRFLFETLDKIGKNDIGVRMLMEKEYPSFGYMIENGATALWERWEKTFGFMTSHDHPMTGGFGVWFFKALGGIYLGLESTPEEIVIRPQAVKLLDRVSCRRSFVSGEAESSWYRLEDRICYDITLPWNMEARVEIRVGDADRITVNGRELDRCGMRAEQEGDLLRIFSNGGYMHIETVTEKR